MTSITSIISIRSFSSIRKQQRFDSIIELISPSSRVVADIGADHGLLSLTIAEHDNVNKVFTVDLSPLALAGARRNLESSPLNIQNKVTIIEGDGLNPILSTNTDVDTIILAGMGTNTAKSICNQNHLNMIKCNSIILQPWPPHLVPVIKLYKHLLDTNNWKIEEQRVVQNGAYQHLTTSFVRSKNIDGDDKNSILNWPLTKRLSKQNKSEENKIFIDYLNNQNNNFFRVKKNKSKSIVTLIIDENDKNHHDIITSAEKDITHILQQWS